MWARQSCGRCLFKSALLAGLASVALSGPVTTAQAITLNTTISIDVYQGAGPNCSTAACEADAREQANQANPLIAPANKLGSGTYTGNINFLESTTNTIGAFLATGGGTLSAGLLVPAVQNAVLSTAPFRTTTVMVIKGTTADILAGTISHDDGISLYNGPGFTNLVAGSASPTVEIPTSFAGLTGNWELIYVEANGLPADLIFDVTRDQAPPPTTPLPAAVWLMGSVLAGAAGFGRWRRRKPATPATAA
jgi:hypothetical protein